MNNLTEILVAHADRKCKPIKNNICYSFSSVCTEAHEEHHSYDFLPKKEYIHEQNFYSAKIKRTKPINPKS